jgi:NADPH2:quinone reductase
MRAARVHALGAPVVVDEVDDPRPGPGEIVVDVAAAAVNFADLLICKGEYQIKADAPFTPGSEFAGTVRAVGDAVTSPNVGDAVVGATFVGAFAEQVLVTAASVSPVPDGVALADAAAFLVAYGTSYSALRSVACVQPDEWVVVLGAAGGVGLAAVDVAVHFGARVVACASSAAKLDVCAQHGAVAGIDYTTEDLKARVKEITGEGADVVMDPVGGSLSEPALRATRYGGRFVVLGFASGEIPSIALNLVLLKGISVTAYEAWSFLMQRPDDASRDREELMQLLATGALRPHVSATYPLDRVGEALAEVGERRATGKVLVVPVGRDNPQVRGMSRPTGGGGV